MPTLEDLGKNLPGWPVRRLRGTLVLIVLLVPGFCTGSSPKDIDQKALDTAYLRGEILKRQGNYAEAIKEYEKVVTLTDRVFGPKHPNTELFLSNLGMLYLEQAQDDRAEPLFVRSLKIAETE